MAVAPNFNQMLAMRVFVRVVEAGTFTNAANSLRMPKPTVTKLVQGLENHLRIKLLNRTTRRVTVTPDGSAYYERVVRLLGDLEDIESSVTHAKERPRGRLRIDAGAAISNFILLPALPGFLAKYPEIHVELGVSDRPADLIGDNVDCVIRGGPLLEPSLVARHIGDLRWMTCATHAYFERHAKPTHPTDLQSGHTLAAYFFPRSGRMRPLTFERDGKTLRDPAESTRSRQRQLRALRQPARRRRAGPDPLVHRLRERRQGRIRVRACGLATGRAAGARALPGQPASIYQGARVHRLGGGAVRAGSLHLPVEVNETKGRGAGPKVRCIQHPWMQFLWLPIALSLFGSDRALHARRLAGWAATPRETG